MNTFRHGPHRRTIRYLGAVAAFAIAVIYFLIGFHLVSVVTSSDQGFGLFAGVAFAVGALLLLAFDKRVYWVLGFVLQVFVMVVYFSLASQRTPAFELWGIALRILQLPLIAVLASLSLHASPEERTQG